MPELVQELVKHRLPIRAGFNPHIYDRIIEEIGRLLEANFILTRSPTLYQLRRKDPARSGRA
jgi:hypothetical protein